MGDDGRLTLCHAMFGIPVIDYRRPSRGLLIGSGSGLMMAIMDLTGRFRFAVDADDCRARPDSLGEWVRALARNDLVDLVAIAGWFSISDPRPLARAVKDLSVPVAVYAGAGIGIDVFGGVWATGELDRFLAALSRAPSDALGLAAD